MRTIPITRRPQRRRVAVTSLPPSRLGPLRRGVGLEVAGELQLTVCLRPHGKPRRSRGDCVGRVYGHDPKIRVRLVLGGSRRSSGRRSFAIGSRRGLTCRQQQPNRNHHCTLSLPWRKITLGANGRRLPRCAPRSCHLNLVASASNPRAGGRQRVVVGGIDKRGRIDNRGEARIAVIRHPQGVARPKRLLARRARTRRLPIAPDGRAVRARSVYSVRLPRPRAGDQLKIGGIYSGAIGTLPYNLRTRTRVILADGPRATRPGPRARRTSRSSAYATISSNFNCTKGPSGHRSPCPAPKAGVLRIGADSRRPLYVNLIAGHGAIGEGSERRRSRHRAHVRRGGSLRVWRYRGPGGG